MLRVEEWIVGGEGDDGGVCVKGGGDGDEEMGVKGGWVGCKG